MSEIEPRLICEIGANHMGDFNLAEKMIKTASITCDVDIIKFQKRDIKGILNNPKYDVPHPNPQNSYGETYAKHRQALEFSQEQHANLKNLCEENGKIYASSVWDIVSAKHILELDPKILKIPSAHNLDFELINYICANFNGEIHLSLGMTYKNEIEEIINFFKEKNKLNRLVLYYCKSTYPCKEEDLNLLQISILKEKYSNQIKAIGFSGHHVGISVDIAALTLGARYFERHFTLDRAFKGTDHAASLAPDGLRRLTRNIREAYLALNHWDGSLDEDELYQRNKLKHISKQL